MCQKSISSLLQGKLEYDLCLINTMVSVHRIPDIMINLGVVRAGEGSCRPSFFCAGCWHISMYYQAVMYMQNVLGHLDQGQLGKTITEALRENQESFQNMNHGRVQALPSRTTILSEYLPCAHCTQLIACGLPRLVVLTFAHGGFTFEKSVESFINFFVT